MGSEQGEGPILITGASGFIGTALIYSLLASERQVIGLSRKPEKLAKRFGGRIRTLATLEQLGSQEPIEAIINLAGEPILDRRWSEARKQLLYQSRLQVTQAVIDLIARLETPPATLVSGSAIGFYGNQVDDMPLNESFEGHNNGFAHKLCHDWEQKALEAERFGVRVCLSRTGVVLGDGGALGRMLLPFKLGLGGPIGHGRQWMSWIHLEDMVAILRLLLDKSTLAGTFNATAPEPVRNREFAATLGAVLHRPAFLPMPALMMKLALGEGAELLTEGQRVVPERLLKAGFEFRYPTLKDALTAVLS